MRRKNFGRYREKRADLPRWKMPNGMLEPEPDPEEIEESVEKEFMKALGYEGEDEDG